MKYFICAISDYANFKNYPEPIINEENELPLLFNSFEEAENFAEKHSLCIAWGYEILEWDW